MSSELREEFFTSIVHFRKLESALSSECEMQMNEMVILQSIAGTCCRECPCMNLDVPKIQKKLNILMCRRYRRSSTSRNLPSLTY